MWWLKAAYPVARILDVCIGWSMRAAGKRAYWMR